MDTEILRQAGPYAVYLSGIVALWIALQRQQAAHREEMKGLVQRYEQLLEEATRTLTQLLERSVDE